MTFPKLITREKQQAGKNVIIKFIHLDIKQFSVGNFSRVPVVQLIFDMIINQILCHSNANKSTRVLCSIQEQGISSTRSVLHFPIIESALSATVWHYPSPPPTLKFALKLNELLTNKVRGEQRATAVILLKAKLNSQSVAA